MTEVASYHCEERKLDQYGKLALFLFLGIVAIFVVAACLDPFGG